MFKDSIFIIKGISGSGKSSRVFQLLAFLMEEGFEYQDYVYRNHDGKDCVIGISFESLGLLFIGKLYTKGGVERWQGYDARTSSFIKAEYFSEFLSEVKGKYGIVIDGAGITQTHRLRPEFLNNMGFKNILLSYYNYTQKEDYLSRIIYRSGEPPKKDVMWDKNTGFIRDLEFSQKDLSGVTCKCKIIPNQFDSPIHDFGVNFFEFTGNQSLISDFMEFVGKFDYISKNSFSNSYKGIAIKESATSLNSENYSTFIGEINSTPAPAVITPIEISDCKPMPYTGETVIKDTPVIDYVIGSRVISVKREDMCIEEAKLSKIRGIFTHLSNNRNSVIGVLDTYHSKAGWGVTYISKLMGKQPVVFYPEFKSEPGLRESQINAKRLGADIVPLEGRLKSNVLWYIARKKIKELYGEDSYLLPNGLTIPESVDATFDQVLTIDSKFFNDTTWVISVSTGTIASGVVRALSEIKSNVDIVIHLGYSKDIERLKGKIESNLGKAGNLNITYVDENYKYRQFVEFECEFPCNKYYDLKAWKWLVTNKDSIRTSKILFWNIGE